MRIALDINRYVDLCKGVGETVTLLEEAEAVVVPFVVLGELRAGFANGRRQAENERTLRRFLLKDGVEVLFADDQTTHHYAVVFLQLRKQGTPIPTNDIWLGTGSSAQSRAARAGQAFRSPPANHPSLREDPLLRHGRARKTISTPGTTPATPREAERVGCKPQAGNNTPTVSAASVERRLSRIEPTTL